MNEYINRIANVAREKFEEAKNLIIEEMQVAMDEAEKNAGSEDSIGKIISDFMSHRLSFCDEDCGCDCECDCDRCEEEDLAWINEDAIDFDEDYQEINLLIQRDEKGELKVAVGYDEEIDSDELPAIFGKAIVESICGDEVVGEALDKKEVDSIIGNALIKAVVDMALQAIKNTLE